MGKKKEIKRKTAYFYRIVKRNAKIFSDIVINNIETCTFFKAHFLKTLNTFTHLFEHSIEIQHIIYNGPFNEKFFLYWSIVDFFKNYLFILGCAGSSLLCVLFSSYSRWELLLLAMFRFLSAVASLFAEHRI